MATFFSHWHIHFNCKFYRQLKRDPDLERIPPRQDYALFLHFVAVGSKDDFLQTLTGRDIPIRGMVWVVMEFM